MHREWGCNACRCGCCEAGAALRETGEDGREDGGGGCFTSGEEEAAAEVGALAEAAEEAGAAEVEAEAEAEPELETTEVGVTDGGGTMGAFGLCKNT